LNLAQPRRAREMSCGLMFAPKAEQQTTMLCGGP
jgi:hypothetical protein